MAVYTFQPSSVVGKDTFIRSGSSADNNYGAIGTMNAGIQTTINRGLIEFTELLTTIPAGRVILSATLTIQTGISVDENARIIGVHRSLVEWFEGSKAGSPPDASQDGSTWNLRNANGSLVWAGGAGGAAGSDWVASATDSISVSTNSTAYDWDVTSDVDAFINGGTPYFGWWLINSSGAADSNKNFRDSGNGTPENRPLLTVITLDNVEGSVAGVSTTTGTLSNRGLLRGTIAGSSIVSGTIISNQNAQGSTAGTSTVSGFLGATVYIQGSSFGDSTVVADIKASYHSVGSSNGTSSHIAHLKGIFELEGSTSGVGSLTATPSFQGQLRGSSSGTSDATATGYARARSVAAVVGCNPVPLFYITNGLTKPNGQLNILNFLSEKNGFILKNYRPGVAQYKDGGRWSSSPQSQGRRLRGRTFDNVIDIIEVAANALDQDALIQYQQEFIAFQEAAADYWSSEYPLLPQYLVSRAARETNTRYAIIHMISCPELENPYAQPFFDDQGAAFGDLTIRVERGLWWSTPPGRFDCVEVSSRKEWTVSGWQTGS